MNNTTPGPWTACKDGECICGHIYGADGTQVATAFGPTHQGDGCDGPESVPDEATQIANAKLIASAPTMAARIAELERQLAAAKAELKEYEGEM